MDSFETSSQFRQILRSLLPQTPIISKAVHFALRNCSSEDYLYYSIIETLEDATVELNTKTTIFQFIDVVIRESFFISQQVNCTYNFPYVHNLKTALPRILDKLLPLANNINLHCIYTNLKNISDTLNVNYLEYNEQYNGVVSLLSSEDMENITLNIPFPKTSIETLNFLSKDPVIQAWEILLHKRKESHYERVRLLRNDPLNEGIITEDEMFAVRGTKPVDSIEKSSEELFTKKQIIARMEDEREAQKRSRETLWVVNRPSGSNFVTEEEFLNYYWKRIEEVTADQKVDFLAALNELNNLANMSYKDNQF
ncbi:hypothetical protein METBISCDRAFT_15806 [Metschnikowia bicuspidata]|uniref:CID domain-containing protein n=1 Tax=Metschnikowia bicuspidata TaxID=27322 RepID=A0A4P9ZEP2_9ASCO|nr:hypothetical protein METBISCDRAFT_15806 [Metschnikowia bicuspidata]